MLRSNGFFASRHGHWSPRVESLNARRICGSAAIPEARQAGTAVAKGRLQLSQMEDSMKKLLLYRCIGDDGL
jgi:hypothetical protein